MRFVAVGLGVMLAASILVGTSTAAAALQPRPAPAAPLFASVPHGGFPDPFPFGQCTWWVAYNRPVTWSGNAADWLTNASVHGARITASPIVGAIVVYRPGGAYSALGHVAIVTAVALASYTVSEMNAVGWGRVSTRTIAWPDPAAAGFILPTTEEAP